MQIVFMGDSLGQPIGELRAHSQKLAKLASDFEGIRINTLLQSDSGRHIEEKYKKATVALKSQQAKLSTLYSTLEEIQEEYSACERRLSGKEEVVVAAGGGSSGHGASGTKTTSENDWSQLKKVIGKFGTIGSVISTAWSITEGGESTWKGVAKLIGTGAKTVSKLADGKAVDWFFSAPSNAGILSKYVYDSSKYTSTMAKNAGMIGVAANWVGMAFDGLLNFRDNMDEFGGDFSNSRMYAETISETALGVFAGWGTQIASGLIVGALVGAAPVWVTGVVGVGVYAVGSMAVEAIDAIWNVDVKEVVSDAIVDFGEAVADGVKNTAKAVGQAVSGTAKKISAGWKKLWGG